MIVSGGSLLGDKTREKGRKGEDEVKMSEDEGRFR
jgi:hypothetical protein